MVVHKVIAEVTSTPSPSEQRGDGDGTVKRCVAGRRVAPNAKRSGGDDGGTAPALPAGRASVASGAAASIHASVRVGGGHSVTSGRRCGRR